MADNQWRDGRLAQVSDDAVRFYEVDKKLFFQHFLEKGQSTGRHKETMFQLMARYGLRDKKILSVGPGDCCQEYWLSESGNQVFLVDIDEGGRIEPALRELQAQQPAGGPGERITYAIGDARRVGDYISKPFDVFVSFSFTPDEYHRSEVQGKLNAAGEAGFGWPVDSNPFSPLILEVCKHLPENGLFISLSYCGGPDATSLTYLPAMKSGLRGAGMELLEVYCLNSAAGVHLVIAEKTSGEVATRLCGAPPISRIHPRSSCDGAARLLYSVCETGPGVEACAGGGHEGVVLEILRAAFPALLEKAGGGRSPVECLFSGENKGEVQGLLKSRINVHVLCGEDSSSGFSAFKNHGSLRFERQGQQPGGDKQADLVWLSMVEADNRLREQAASRGTAGGRLFSSGTHRQLRRLKKDGGLVVVGRAGLATDTAKHFQSQLREELGENGIALEDLYALKVAPGIFMAIGRKASAARQNESIGCFYPLAEDSSVSRVAWAPEPNREGFKKRLMSFFKFKGLWLKACLFFQFEQELLQALPL